MTMQMHNWDTLVVGLGQTGLSVARHLQARGVAFAVVDSRANPPGKAELLAEFPQTPYHFGAFAEAADWFASAATLVVSPGIAIATPEIHAAGERGAAIIGDIELFVRETQAPVIAITGSNGKSSVTTLVDLMAQKAGMKSYAGGNLGYAALDLLAQPTPDLYVMELSSFQLETTQSLRAISAVVLNVSEDHMDRYPSFADYAAAKQVAYQHCGCAVVNRDDAVVMAMLADLTDAERSRSVSFGLDIPTDGQYGLREHAGKRWLAKGETLLLAVDAMKLPGEHNYANALAALALGEAAGIPLDGMLAALREFSGLAHRTQWVRERAGVNWYNDSKGTNVGATLAALAGLPGKTVLIAGGQGKGADFSPLRAVAMAKARALVLIGEDRNKIADMVEGYAPYVFAHDMADAVAIAAELAQAGDNVLLSPACASFDMFKSYVHRGDVFTAEVRSLP
ncbi:UDP-N-acetylmuramoyl-L-alanine--D-glutamate ligase [Thiothrix subterranea]|uniref:UDP-N-acetylmuramoylalanine--D-glutamate ligase n=1 Tax=Thiothrix subterranea TaxID=2735563 RepID=A0AA51MLZ8_9GAMM|nr:UDP-N-acetylmuramoyl-L-alanine--D-glutamate ligase [Thiothrix subterranea]MDQ5767828.1 UDP-N-acetylmuramoyl-L-alanine--D-glutamate ligase [Thiothrix subterranea]WML86710.1 UDP-N-acetylmuramoyl-L-alanine--D-glutamate ligase [Thiothrix subterranea]